MTETLIKRSKKSILVDFSDHFQSLLIIIDIFLNFSIKSGNDIIDFITMIRTSNSDKKSQLKDDSNLIPDKI